MGLKDDYSILDIDVDASTEDIKRASARWDSIVNGKGSVNNTERRAL